MLARLALFTKLCTSDLLIHTPLDDVNSLPEVCPSHSSVMVGNALQVDITILLLVNLLRKIPFISDSTLALLYKFLKLHLEAYM